MLVMCSFLHIFMKEVSDYDVSFPPPSHLRRRCVLQVQNTSMILEEIIKLKSLIPCSECVTRNDFIRQSVTEGKREIKLVITAVRDTHFIVYWYIEVNTDLQNGDVIVSGIAIVICIYDYSCNCMDSSTSIWISGASPHRESADRYPVDSKIMK